MEQTKNSQRYSILRQLNHRKMRSFQMKELPSPRQKQNKTAILLINSKSAEDFPLPQYISDFSLEQSMLPKLQTKSTRKNTTSDVEEKQARHKYFIKVYNHKISRLITSNTAQQKERFMRKLNQALSDDAFVAIGYEFDPSYVKFLNEIFTFSLVSKIVLDNNPLGDAGIIKLSTVLHKLPLKQLSLVSVSMGNAGATALFNSLKEVHTLVKMNISTVQSINKNKLTADGAQPLKMLLSSPTCMIETLHMNHLRLGSEGARTAFEGVSNTTVQCLSLSKNDIGMKNVHIFIQSLARVPLMRLDLSKNSIRDPGIKSLTDILGVYYSKNSISMNLSHLNISTNGITSQGFQYFCRQMSGNRTLQSLILDQNPLGEGDRFFNIKYYLSKNWGLKKLSLNNVSPSQKDVKFICEGMQSNRSLEELSLSKNQVDCETLSFIFFMLSKNKALRRITLNNCKISDSFLMKNEYMIGSNFTSIEEIDLQNNYINLKGAQILKKLISANQNILKLSVGKNCIPETCIDEINQILKENQSKRPFQHQLKYFYSVSDLYEEKKKALRSEVQTIKKEEQKIKTRLLAEQIELDLNVEENLKKKIAKQQYKIRQYQSTFHINTLQIQDEIQELHFVTNAIYKK